ncbi:MAG: extracellular solute-binding protein [Lachnospiraceae bacterium]|nr:extracellular solute-binding protein [Lachnospiraceae bacterium]
MTKIKKMLALFLALAMVLAMFTGCGSDADETESSVPELSNGFEDVAEEEDTRRDVGGLKLPLCAEKQELTVWLIYSGTVMADLNDVAGVKQMEENTNVHINWIPVEQNELSEKYGILLASGDYPDIIYSNMSYPGGFEVGVEDGVISPDMDSLIRNYMPNYMALINSSDQARREACNDEGKMLVARIIVGQDYTAESEGTYQGLAYRADLLEQLGMDVPTTVDGWHDVLVAAKNAGIPNPFVLDQNGGSALSGAWGISTESANNWLMLKGDTITSGAVEDEFEDYLNTMKAWYAEGLINPNFTSFHFYLDTPNSVNTNDSILYSRVLSAFTGNNYAMYRMVTEQPNEFLQAITAPSLNEGDPVVQAAGRVIAKEGIYITTACENPALAAQWLDYQYSFEGMLLNWYGIENETYTLDADGIPQFTEAVFNNDSGLSTNDYLSQYALNWGNSWLGKHCISASWKVSTTAAGGHNQELESDDIWSEPETNVWVTSSLTLTEEESDAISSELTALVTMINEYTVNYIIGQDVKPFEEFREDLYSFGLQEVLDTYQAAYDRYLAR